MPDILRNRRMLWIKNGACVQNWKVLQEIWILLVVNVVVKTLMVLQITDQKSILKKLKNNNQYTKVINKGGRRWIKKELIQK